MSKTITSLSTSNTFQNWLDKTNEIVDLINSDVMTASPLGDTTLGDCTLIGDFTANTVIATDLFRANTISPKSGSNFLTVTGRLDVNTNLAIISRYTSAVGPKQAFTDGNVEWKVGFEATGSTNFAITTGSNSTVRIKTGGNIEATGTVTATSFIGNLDGDVLGDIVGNVTGNVSGSASRLATGRTIGMTGDVVWTSPAFNGSANVTAAATIQNKAITNAKIRDSDALSIIGRSANTGGTPGDISAASDFQVLRRNGNVLGFGSIRLDQSAAVAGILGVSNGGSGRSSLTDGKILVGNGTDDIESANLYWDSTNNRLGVNVPAPSQALNVNGNILATGDIIAFSDEKLKSNIVTIDKALEKVSAIRGVYFDKDGKRSLGVIAQEIEKVLPEVVIDGEYKSVAYGNIVGLLIEAIKDLKQEIETIKG